MQELQASLDQTRTELEALEKNFQDTQAELKQVKSDYQALQKDAQNVISITRERDQLRVSNEELAASISKLEGDNSSLMKTGVIKWFLAAMSLERFAEIAVASNDPSAEAMVTIGYLDGGGEPRFFEGILKGKIVFPRGMYGFGWDQVFVPEGFDETFGIRRGADPPYGVVLFDSSRRGMAFHPGVEVEIAFQVSDLSGKGITADGHVEVIHYCGREKEGDQWHPEFHRIAAVGRVPVLVELDPNAWQDVRVTLPVPETKGGYAAVLDLGRHGRRLVANFVRTHAVGAKRTQFPKQSLEAIDPEVLEGLGVQAIRMGI